MRTILITGAAGFIGSHLTMRAARVGNRVVAVDNFDPFYRRELKTANIRGLQSCSNVRFIEADVRDNEMLLALPERFDAIIHLAARPGVRASIIDPWSSTDVNIRGTLSLLEFARQRGIATFLFASSSSVYGLNENLPWNEADINLRPVSPYASSKLSGESLGSVYSYLHGIRFLALRFFSVYGPRQRPDLAVSKFIRMMQSGTPIPFFGEGSALRDYTFVDDIVSGVLAALEYESNMFEVFNLGNGQAVSLTELVSRLEEVLQKKAILKRMPDQPGDVPATWANIEKAVRLLGYSPQTTLSHGLRITADWVRAAERVASDSS